MADFTARYPSRVAAIDGPTASMGLFTAIGASVLLWATIIGTIMAIV